MRSVSERLELILGSLHELYVVQITANDLIKGLMEAKSTHYKQTLKYFNKHNIKESLRYLSGVRIKIATNSDYICELEPKLEDSLGTMGDVERVEYRLLAGFVKDHLQTG